MPDTPDKTHPSNLPDDLTRSGDRRLSDNP